MVQMLDIGLSGIDMGRAFCGLQGVSNFRDCFHSSHTHLLYDYMLSYLLELNFISFHLR